MIFNMTASNCSKFTIEIDLYNYQHILDNSISCDGIHFWSHFFIFNNKQNNFIPKPKIINNTGFISINI